MTSKQRAVIERARQTPARFVEIERVTRFTAYRNMAKQLTSDELFQMTFQREIALAQKLREENS